MKHWWIPALLFLPASPGQATQTFSHDTGPLRWEAEVTGDTFILREKKESKSAGNEFVCPLGPAVRASIVRTGSDAGRVCLVFSRDKCVQKNAESAPGNPLSPMPAVATFKCLDFGTSAEASALAALINAGTRTQVPATSARVPAVSKSPVAATRPSGAAQPAGAASGNPQLVCCAVNQVPPVPVRAAPAVPATPRRDAERAPAKKLAGGHGL
jgi:hypothetical protein